MVIMMFVVITNELDFNYDFQKYIEVIIRTYPGKGFILVQAASS